MSFKNALHRRRHKKVTDELDIKASRGEEKKHRLLTDHKLLKMVTEHPEEDIEEYFE